MTIEDDGEGFDRAATHEGFGLLGMQERVALIGGSLEVTSTPGQGSRVSATMPAERVS